MSFYKNDFDRIKITGIGTGSWTTIDIATFLTVPVGTTAVHLKYDSVGTASSTYGARKVGSADTFTNAANARAKNDKWIELTGTSVELFLGTPANGEWYIEGLDTHFTFVTPVEKGGSVTSGTYTLDYSAELPAEAANGSVLMELSRGVRIGAYGNVSLLAVKAYPRGHVILPLDSLKRLQYISGGGTTLDSDLRMIAWAPEGAVIHMNTYTATTVATANTWLPLPDTSTETALGMWRMYSTSDNNFWGMRASDNTTDTDVATNLLNRFTYSKHGADGVTDVNVSNAAVQFYYFGGIVSSLAAAAITGIDQLVAGQTTEVTISPIGFLATEISISDGSVTKTIATTYVSDGVYSITCPTWTDGVTGLQYGTVNVTASDGAESTAVFPFELLPPTGYATEILDEVNPLNYLAGETSPLVIGSQILFKTTEGLVYKSGIYDNNGTGFTGTTSIGDRDPDTGIVNFADVVISGGTPVLTSSSNNHYIGLGLGIGF